MVQIKEGVFMLCCEWHTIYDMNESSIVSQMQYKKQLILRNCRPACFVFFGIVHIKAHQAIINLKSSLCASTFHDVMLYLILIKHVNDLFLLYSVLRTTSFPNQLNKRLEITLSTLSISESQLIHRSRGIDSSHYA